jgi:hypothetical protein
MKQVMYLYLSEIIPLKNPALIQMQIFILTFEVLLHFQYTVFETKTFK